MVAIVRFEGYVKLVYMRHFSEKATGRQTGGNSNPNSYQVQRENPIFFRFAQQGFLLWVVTLLSTRSVRNINHPLSGCAVFVTQKNHLSVIIRLFKPIYNERKGDFNGQ